MDYFLKTLNFKGLVKRILKNLGLFKPLLSLQKCMDEVDFIYKVYLFLKVELKTFVAEIYIL